MSIHDFRESVNQRKSRMRMQTINNVSSAANSAVNILAKGAELVNKTVQENAVLDATTDYEDNYQEQLRKAMDDGVFDTDGNGNVITSIDQINSNISDFNQKYLENYKGSALSKKKLEQMIHASGDVYTNNILKGILVKQNELKEKGAEEYGGKIVNSTIPNIAAYNEDTLSRGITYEDLDASGREYYDSGTEWGAKCLRYDLYLKDIDYTTQERAYIMRDFEKLVKEEQWFGNVSSYYSDHVIDGSMQESEFYEILKKDLTDSKSLELLGIEEGNNTLISAYQAEAMSRTAKLRETAVREHTQRFDDGFNEAVTGYVNSGNRLTQSALAEIMGNINVNPEMLSSKEKAVYDGFSEYASHMDWAISLDEAMAQLSTLDRNDPDFRRKASEIYADVANPMARQTMNMYADRFYSDPSGTIALASVDVSKIIRSNPIQDVNLPTLDKTSPATNPLEGTLFSSYDDMAYLKSVLDEYYDTGNITALRGTEQYKKYKESDPDSSDSEIAFQLMSEYNTLYVGLEQDQKSLINEQKDLYDDGRRRADSEILNNTDSFESLAVDYAYSNGDIKDPLLDIRFQNLYMNESPENLRKYVEWCRSQNVDGQPMRAGSASFTTTDDFQQWLDEHLRYGNELMTRNMDTELKDGNTVRATYEKLIDAENWNRANSNSMTGFITKGAPESALIENQKAYNELAAKVTDSFEGYNSSTLESEIMLAYWNSRITEDQKESLLEMSATFTSPAMQSLGINVKKLVDDKLGSGVDETSPWYNSLLSSIASRISSEVDPINRSDALLKIGNIIDNSINDFNFGLTQGEVARKIDKINDFDELSDYLTGDASYLRYDSEYPDYYGKSFDFMFSRNPSSTISEYYLKPGKVGDEINIVRDLNDEDFAFALLSEALGFTWDSSMLSKSDYKTSLFNSFNDLDDYSKTAVIGTVQYGLQVRNTARQLKEDGYEYERMSNDGRVFYYGDGSYLIPETDKKGNVANITYGGNGKEEIRVPSDAEMNDMFLIYFQNYLKSNFNRVSFSGTELEYWLDDALSKFIEENEYARIKTDYGFKASISTGFELSKSRKTNNFNVYSVPDLNKNFDIGWEKNY